MQLETSPMPISMMPMRPIRGSSVLRMQTWRTEREVRRGCVFTQLSSPFRVRSEVGFSSRQVPSSLQVFSMVPEQGACHLWQHQGLRKAWQTVPPTKDSSTICFTSAPILLTPNMSQREQLSSFSQKLLSACTPRTGCLGLGRQQESELLTMQWGRLSTGRASWARCLTNHSFQFLKPKYFSSEGSGTRKSLYSTRSLESHPSLRALRHSCDLCECSIVPQASKICLRWALTLGLLKKPWPQQLLRSAKKRMEKGTPMMGALEQAGGEVATVLISHITSSMVCPQSGVPGTVCFTMQSRLPCRHMRITGSEQMVFWSSFTSRSISVVFWSRLARCRMYLQYLATASLSTERTPPPRKFFNCSFSAWGWQNRFPALRALMGASRRLVRRLNIYLCPSTTGSQFKIAGTQIRNPSDTYQNATTIPIHHVETLLSFFTYYHYRNGEWETSICLVELYKQDKYELFS